MLSGNRVSAQGVKRQLALVAHSFMRSGDRHNHKKRRMASEPVSTKVQQLYRSAQVAFQEGSQPSDADVAAVRQALESVPLEDLGLSDTELNRLSARRNRWTPSITYQHIFENNNMSIGIFSLTKGAQLPLHNHPGMTVLSRVLYGRMHILSFDWEDAQDMTSTIVTEQKRAIQMADMTLEATDAPSVLYPRAGGNMHQFTAVESCAVLDVLAPPYDPHDEERDCTYFRVKASEPAAAGQPTKAILEPFAPPSGFQVVPQAYQGRRITVEY